MGLFIKKDPTRSSGINWSSAKKIFIKQDPNRSALVNWPQVLAAYVKVSATQWKKFFGAAYAISKPVIIIADQSLGSKSLRKVKKHVYPKKTKKTRPRPKHKKQTKKQTRKQTKKQKIKKKNGKK